MLWFRVQDLDPRVAMNEIRRAEPGSLCIFALCCTSFSRMSLGYDL